MCVLFVSGGKSEGRHENSRYDAFRRIPSGFSRHNRQLCARYQLRANGHGDLNVLSCPSIVSGWCANYFSTSTLPSYARQDELSRVGTGEERAIQERERKRELLIA